MQNRYRLKGALRESAFVAAWRSVVARHSILRTSFVWKSQKRPLQVVHAAVDTPFLVIDLTDLSAAEQERRISWELGQELSAGFDFGKAPLMRFRLYRLRESSDSARTHSEEPTYEFVHSFHHILLDEWCTSLLMMDFIAHYEAMSFGAELKVSQARPYGDYIEWLVRQDRAAGESFWRSYLKGFSAPTPFGLEPLHQPASAGVEDLESSLNAEATAALNEVTQQSRLTLSTVVQGAWALLMSRYSGELEVGFGITVAGRPPELQDVDSIVGLFINTLPLRVKVRLDQPLLPWLGALLAQNIQLRQYEYMPLVDIQRCGEIERGQSMFQSLLVFENAPVDPALRAGNVFPVHDVRYRVHTNYPITVMAWRGTELGLRLSYDRARIDRSAGVRMLDHLRTLLEGIAARPEARLGELPLLTSAEHQQAIEWAGTVGQSGDLDSFAALFQAQVDRTPNAPAATHLARTLTYAELNRAANRLAHALRAQRVGPEDIVATFDERGLELLVMIVAVFKAGAAYVPIDPSYPVARVASILALSRPRVILTRTRLRALLGDAFNACEKTTTGGSEYAPITLEDVMEAGWPEHDVALAPANPHRLAYVIFTSGSTGVPKGVMVEERGMLNNMLSKIPRLGLNPGDVIAQTASPCFDISVWQHLTALLFGGRVEIVPDDVVRDPACLLEYVVSSEISIIEVVPAVLQGLLDAAREGGATGLRRLRWVLPTGEALPATLAHAWLEQFPGVPLMNAYGPAECSDDVALHPILAVSGAEVSSVPIGRPVEHLQLYVLDRGLQLLPVGVSGELYVGGIGVGRGYLGDPGRTAEAFVPDPFGGVPGARLYRTGDVARYLSDGAFEFVGRQDQQIKIRGLRIELGEIEARLLEAPGVRDCAVVVRETRPGVRQLTAYLVTNDSASGNEENASDAPSGKVADELRAFLAMRLPDYMVPTGYVLLPTMPRSPNGKVDRRALPVPNSHFTEVQVAPRTSTEEKLAAIWAEVLEVPRVGVEDSFFSLGGHSLLLTKVLARVRRVFEIELPLRALFEVPTVAAQAGAIDAVRQRDTTRLGGRAQELEEGPWPLSFAQERLWFLAQLEFNQASYNVPVAVRLVGDLDVARLRQCFATLGLRHELLRTRFAEVDGKPSMLVEAEAIVLPPPIDLRGVPDGQRLAHARELLEQEAARPFELSQGPLGRLTLLRLGEEEHLLLVVLHHIVSDGWSLGIMLRELIELYESTAKGRPASLAPLVTRYSDYVRWQRERLSGVVLDQQLAHWKDHLRGELPTLALPTDRPRPALCSHRGARHAFVVPEALRESLDRLAKQRGLTLYMLLLAAFELLLARASGQNRFCVGTPVANRTHEELEGIIGLFVNTLVLLVELEGDPSCASVLEGVREEVLAAQAYQDLPFEQLVQALQPKRDLGQSSLFQVMFSVQELERSQRVIDGLAVLPFEIDPKSAQFDLSLHMAVDTGGLSGAFEYSTDLFEATTIERAAGAFIGLLEVMATRPATRLSELQIAPWQANFAAAPTNAEDAPASPEEPSVGMGERSTLAHVLEVEEQLAQIWSAVLGREAVAPNDNFFELGGDSILSLDVVARARRGGLDLRAQQIFQHQTLRELAASALPLTGHGGEEESETGPVSLLPVQRRFFARDLPNWNHWNQSLLLSCREHLDETALEEALQALVRHHDALRLRFVRDGQTFRAFHASDEVKVPVHRTDLSVVPVEQRANMLDAHAARWQASLDVAAGPVLRAVLFDLGVGEPNRLLLVAHHLVVDVVSWRILLPDLELAYDQASQKVPIRLPEKTTSLREWGEHLARAATDSGTQGEALLWLDLPWERVAPLPVDEPLGQCNEASRATHAVVLPESGTRALLQQAAPKASGSTVEQIVLTALVLALTRYSRLSVMAIDLEHHGREPFEDGDIDLSRTVGWFTRIYPVVLEIGQELSTGDALAAVKEQLRRLPPRGRSYDVVRELGGGEVADKLSQLPAARIGFNYLGQWDGVLGSGARFALTDERRGLEHDPRSPLSYELEVEAAVFMGQLETSFVYSSARFRTETIQSVGALFLSALEELVVHCREVDAAAYVPSDFPDMALSAGDLAAILEQMD
jgi:amino acid adenylation domain-containing protein/non-ribosomal peptide synthase protein (TIGR01720 family)